LHSQLYNASGREVATKKKWCFSILQNISQKQLMNNVFKVIIGYFLQVLMIFILFATQISYYMDLSQQHQIIGL
jgi:hypothetical protein